MVYNLTMSKGQLHRERSTTHRRRSPSPRLRLRRSEKVVFTGESSVHPSPPWSSTTKLLAGLSILAVAILLFTSLKIVLGPLLLAAVIAYLMYPLAARLHRIIKVNWRVLVSTLYLLIYLIFFGLLTWGGIKLVEQIQSLIHFVEGAVKDIPGLIQSWVDSPPVIGPFVVNLQQMDVMAVANQVLGIVQPLLGQAGTLVGSLASSAAAIIGWTLFSFLLSYFIVSETGGHTDNILRFTVPGYSYDIQRLMVELSSIWNAFLRGQLVVFLLVSTTYMVIYSILGVQFFYGLALLVGLGRFIPYLGQWVGWGVALLVAYSQGSTIFGMDQGTYALVVFAFGVVVDAMIDNFVTPRIFSSALKIHPAAVMVAAIIGLNTIGIVGVFLAAPALATFKLFFDYVFSKMLGRDPWENFVRASPQRIRFALREAAKKVWRWAKAFATHTSQWIRLRLRPATPHR